MNKTLFFLPFCLLANLAFSQQISTDHKITFKLKITELENPGSVSILGPVRPWINFNAATKTVMTIDSNGFYSAILNIPDSLLYKKLKYTFRNDKNRTDIRREIIIKENSPIIQTDLWGYLDGLEGKVKPFQQMLASQTNTPEEAAVLAKPYFGITFDGKKQPGLFPIQPTGQSTLPTKIAVEDFLNSLSSEQKAKCSFPIDSDEWRKWHNIEFYKRTGIGLEELSPTQKELAFKILEVSLSPKGLKKSKDVMAMETYLAYITPANKLLGGEKYWFTFMGTPSISEPWGFQFDGHHLIINYFILGDQIVMTPTFMGSEPNYIPEGPNKGLRTYEAEERKGLAFFNSLDAKQKQKATVWHNLDQDFNRTEAFRDNEILPKQGISAKELNQKQIDILLDLIKEYVGNMKEGHANLKMAEVKKHLNETYFSWVQTDGVDDLYYYRIHSPVILIEFDHQIPVAVWDRDKPRPGPVKYHIHTVVRTPNGNDYGKDLLKEHLELHRNGVKH
ncbi:MAG: DUF3500 domain-containing protein [Leadbetterella sp.]|nr:DUF3500 domain-containing protein [Leadbetterella sp.]